MNDGQLQEAANKLMELISDNLKNGVDLGKFALGKTADVGKSALEKFDDVSIEIIKGRHENLIYQKIKGIKEPIVDKLKPFDQLHLLDKLQKPVSASKDFQNTGSSNYLVQVDGEPVYQESAKGGIIVNKIKQFLTPELESERNEITIAEALSAEYDPPPNNAVQAEPEFEAGQIEEYSDDQVRIFDAQAQNNPILSEQDPTAELIEEYEDQEIEEYEDQEIEEYEQQQIEEYEDQESPFPVDYQPQNTQAQPNKESEQPVVETPSQNTQTEPDKQSEQSVVETPPRNTEFQVSTEKSVDEAQPKSYKNIANTVSFVEKDIKTVKTPRIKSLLKSTISRLQDRIGQLSQAVSRQFELSRQKSAAKTFKQLFDANLQKTDETTFKSNNFDVKLQGLNTYQVSDREGNIKLEFNQKKFGLEINQSSLSGTDFKSIEQATEAVESLGAETVLQKSLSERIGFLGSIAPKADHQIAADLNTKAVAKTATSFLHYMGVNSWNREGGPYEIQKSGDNLQIKDKDNGQEILKITKGTLSSKLKPKDVNFFKNLESSMEVQVNEARKKNQELTSQLSSKPKRFNQQELSR